MNRGFTFVATLSALAVLAAILVFALVVNPKIDLAETRNAERFLNVEAVATAVMSYAADNTGRLPSTIAGLSCSDASTEICQTRAASCAGLVDLSSLTLNQKYLSVLPLDPSGPTTTDGTGYRIAKNADGGVTVCAPAAEATTTIISATH